MSLDTYDAAVLSEDFLDTEALSDLGAGLRRCALLIPAIIVITAAKSSKVTLRRIKYCPGIFSTSWKRSVSG